MARARNIKPSIMENENLADMEPLSRLLFIYLWMLADREGRLEDRPRRIGAQALPYDRDADIDAMLNDLQAGGFIVRYVAQGQACIQIVTFAEHQRPHQNETASVLPPVEAGEPVEAGASPVEGGQEAGKSGVAPKDEGLPPMGEALRSDSLIPDSLNDDSLIADSLGCPAPKRETAAKRKRLPHDTLPDKWRDYCRTTYPQYDPDREFEAFSDHHRSKGSVMADWLAAWRTWLRNAEKFGGAKPASKTIRESTADHNKRAFDEWLAESDDGRTIDA